MIRIQLSRHARKRVFERNIEMTKIKRAIRFPNYKIIRGLEIEAFLDSENKTLKVVYVRKAKYIKIITAYYVR